jgi:hypothetical protein
MKKNLFLVLIALVAFAMQGCCTRSKVTRTYEENTTRTISSEPQIGTPAR